MSFGTAPTTALTLATPKNLSCTSWMTVVGASPETFLLLLLQLG
jgi:hypothetical protein